METRRIFTIDDKAVMTAENLKKLADLFYKETNNEYDLAIFEDHLDDSNWNDGDGISHICDDTEFYRNISIKFGRIAFTVHEVTEDDDIYDYKCCNGIVDEIYLGNLWECYSDTFDETCDNKMGDMLDFANEQEEVEDEFNEFVSSLEPYPVLYGNKIALPAKA
ncbi:MAG: hypothetical protein [Wendovervirus sonii]|uniref:Antirestriction protein n=1 Tax=phage Lak_Megaphage_Sonny TaxID=3109229 RepID=A0ABZ0Z5K7_9CAUD|nr:MAG: hypothetical protein [phage Lak_Megaphage_Sonny]